MLRMDYETFGYALANGYGVARPASGIRHEALKGRPRYRVSNRQPVYVLNISYQFDEEQYSTFQSFWRIISSDPQPFEVLALLTLNQQVQSIEYVECRATGSHSAVLAPAGYWIVTFEIEVPFASPFGPTICNVITAGSPGAPADDIIWNGPIDNLPTDIIAPCAGVLPL